MDDRSFSNTVLKEYKLQTSTESLFYGRLGSIIATIIVPLFYLKDVYLTNYPESTFIWRLIPIIMNVIFLILSFTLFIKKRETVNFSFFILSLSYLVMILGIFYQNFGQAENKYDQQLIISLIAVIFLIFLFSKGISEYMVILVIPYAGFIFQLMKNKDLNVFELSQIFNPTAVFIVLLIMSQINRKQRFSEFSMKKKLEFNKGKLEKEITRRKELEKKLELDALTDELTGCFNRKAAEKIIYREVKIATREKITFSLCYIDINNLKAINDKQGHKAGDKLITDFCENTNIIIRETDFLFRVGGDEFIIFFYNCTEKNAQQIIDQIISLCENQNISFSYGIVDKTNNHHLSIEQLISKADKRMYQQKKAYKSQRLINHN